MAEVWTPCADVKRTKPQSVATPTLRRFPAQSRRWIEHPEPRDLGFFGRFGLSRRPHSLRRGERHVVCPCALLKSGEPDVWLAPARVIPIRGLQRLRAHTRPSFLTPARSEARSRAAPAERRLRSASSAIGRAESNGIWGYRPRSSQTNSYKPTLDTPRRSLISISSQAILSSFTAMSGSPPAAPSWRCHSEIRPHMVHSSVGQAEHPPRIRASGGSAAQGSPGHGRPHLLPS